MQQSIRVMWSSKLAVLTSCCLNSYDSPYCLPRSPEEHCIKMSTEGSSNRETYEAQIEIRFWQVTADRGFGEHRITVLCFPARWLVRCDSAHERTSLKCARNNHGGFGVYIYYVCTPYWAAISYSIPPPPHLKFRTYAGLLPSLRWYRQNK